MEKLAYLLRRGYIYARKMHAMPCNVPPPPPPPQKGKMSNKFIHHRNTPARARLCARRYMPFMHIQDIRCALPREFLFLFLMSERHVCYAAPARDVAAFAAEAR